MATTNMMDITVYYSLQEITKDISLTNTLVDIDQSSILPYALDMLGTMRSKFNYKFPVFIAPTDNPDEKQTIPGIQINAKVTYMNPILFRNIVINYFSYLYLKNIQQDYTEYYTNFEMAMTNFAMSPEGQKSPYKVKLYHPKWNRGAY